MSYDTVIQQRKMVTVASNFEHFRLWHRSPQVYLFYFKLLRHMPSVGDWFKQEFWFITKTIELGWVGWFGTQPSSVCWVWLAGGEARQAVVEKAEVGTERERDLCSKV